MANCIITIGRQCGSGGHTIAKLVAQKLELPFYDKKIVELAAAKTKLSPEFIKSHGEYFHGGSFGHILGYGTRFDSPSKMGSSLTDELHEVQSEIILEVAAEGSCVIVGRCADYILEGKFPTLNVFIHADVPFKVEHSVQCNGMDPDKAESILKRRDKARAHHYKFYTGQKWGDAQHYDLSLDSGRLGMDVCVDIIADVYHRITK